MRQYKTRFCYIKDNVCYVPLLNNKIAVCDEDRFDDVAKYSWKADRNGYPCAKILGFTTRLHSFLYKAMGSIDHINQNKLDNRSCNLRFVTESQNRLNRPKNKTTKNPYKGISFRKDKQRWIAQIGFNGKNIVCGYCKTPEEAAKCYNAKAIELYGEYAFLNFLEVKHRVW